LGAERGWPAPSPDQFAQEVRHGALHLGSPETVARKIANTVRTLGATRFGMKYGNGRLPHELMMESIELYGTRVKPLVLDILAESEVVEASFLPRHLGMATRLMARRKSSHRALGLATVRAPLLQVPAQARSLR